MLSCKELTEHASDYIDGEMSLTKRLSVKFHLLMCHHCRRFVSQFRESISLIKETDALPTSYDDTIEHQVSLLIKVTKKDDTSVPD